MVADIKHYENNSSIESCVCMYSAERVKIMFHNVFEEKSIDRNNKSAHA